MSDINNGLKELAGVLIDQCFADRPYKKRQEYKDFKLRLLQQPYRSRLGCYNMLSKTIELSGMSTECRHDIIITFLHELSHHIEMVDKGNTGHQKYFYEIHIKLLQYAVDLGLLKTEHITDNKTSLAGNAKKLGRMMVGYRRKGNANLSEFMNTGFLSKMPEIIKNTTVIQVKCFPEDRFLFKGHGYIWKPTELVWEKTLPNTAAYNEELKYLSKNGFQNVKIDKTSYFAKAITICAFGETYANKETIASLGYHYKNGVWSKPVRIKYVETETAKLRKLNGVKVKYEF